MNPHSKPLRQLKARMRILRDFLRNEDNLQLGAEEAKAEKELLELEGRALARTELRDAWEKDQAYTDETDCVDLEL